MIRNTDSRQLSGRIAHVAKKTVLGTPLFCLAYNHLHIRTIDYLRNLYNAFDTYMQCCCLNEFCMYHSNARYTHSLDILLFCVYGLNQ